ncbi:hypothetical protein JCM21900_006303 [Sporobolomyces salmonicolor]
MHESGTSSNSSREEKSRSWALGTLLRKAMPKSESPSRTRRKKSTCGYLEVGKSSSLSRSRDATSDDTDDLDDIEEQQAGLLPSKKGGGVTGPADLPYTVPTDDISGYQEAALEGSVRATQWERRWATASPAALLVRRRKKRQQSTTRFARCASSWSPSSLPRRALKTPASPPDRRASARPSSRRSRLAALAAQGRAAALPTEMARIEEAVEALRLVVRQNRERARQAAWGEVQGRESLRRRVRERIRSDTPGLAEEHSYGGRVAAETPLAELAHLIDDAANERRTAMGGAALERENTWTTLGRSTVEYSKFELGEEGDGAEHQLLAGGAGEGAGLGEAELGGLAGEGAKLSMGMRLRLKWKDYLVRTMLLATVIGIIVGIIVYEALNQDGDSDSTDTTATSS